MKMITIKEIQDIILRQHGKKVRACWIIQVKEKHGLLIQKQFFRNYRENQCPSHIKPLIEQVFKERGVPLYHNLLGIKPKPNRAPNWGESKHKGYKNTMNWH